MGGGLFLIVHADVVGQLALRKYLGILVESKIVRYGINLLVLFSGLLVLAYGMSIDFQEHTTRGHKIFAIIFVNIVNVICRYFVIKYHYPFLQYFGVTDEDIDEVLRRNKPL